MVDYPYPVAGFFLGPRKLVQSKSQKPQAPGRPAWNRNFQSEKREEYPHGLARGPHAYARPENKPHEKMHVAERIGVVRRHYFEFFGCFSGTFRVFFSDSESSLSSFSTRRSSSAALFFQYPTLSAKSLALYFASLYFAFQLSRPFLKSFASLDTELL